MNSSQLEVLFTVTANFTAEPIGEVLRFWMGRLALANARLHFSGYNQVFQELMSQESVLASSATGVNFVFIRLEDWGRDQSSDKRLEVIIRTATEFVDALRAFVQRTKRPTLLMLCPVSKAIAVDAELASRIESLTSELESQVRSIPRLKIVTAADVAALYPVKTVDDPESDRQAHIPFTHDYWAAMATVLARSAHSLISSPHKVIVVDADNTLWGGVVGEVGPTEVRLDGEWNSIQRFLLDKKKQGMLLAIASKNEEPDVAEVFRRPDMVLRRNDFVAWRINWEPKSRNIATLAKDLELGLESFIFLDDNPVECAEVAGNCPGVTSLLLPANTKDIPNFLQSVWAFDIQASTSIDEKRTDLYREQTQRNEFRNAAGSFRDFIAGLQLQVETTSLSPAQFERAAQLTQRTNQFNTSGIRRTASELSSLLERKERDALIVHARDRFGDYGEVGLAIFSCAGKKLEVDTLLLSCRVLGKGVEHQLLNALGRTAERCDATGIEILFKRTSRNQPAEKFLKSIGAHVDANEAFRIDAASACTVMFDPESGATPETVEEKGEYLPSTSSKPDFLLIATELNSIEKVTLAVERELRHGRSKLDHPRVPPRTAIESKLIKIWEDVLHVDQFGVTDPFVSVGGQSLQAVSIVSRIADEFHVRLPLIVLLSNPTIAELVEHLRTAPPIDDAVAIRGGTKTVLSPAQQRLWFLDQFIPNRAAYNIPVARRIQGRINLSALDVALSALVARHDMLRSSYTSEEGSASQKISEPILISAKRLQASSEAEALLHAREEATQPFDLSVPPLLRCTVITWGELDHLLILNVHHIVSDGWSMGLLMRDLSHGYRAALQGAEPLLTAPDISYRDYAQWQQEKLSAREFTPDLEYWKSELRDPPSLLELPTDYPRPSVMRYVGDSVTASATLRSRRAVESFAAQEECTPFAVLLAAWQAVLHRYCRQDDIIVGVPVAGRTERSLEGVVGCFVNTLAIRATVSSENSFQNQVHTAAQKLISALAHQELPFEALVSDLGLERDLSRAPLFQVMVVLQDTPKGNFAAAGLEVSDLAIHNGGAKFDLVLEVTPVETGYSFALEFSTSLFLRETASRMLKHFIRVLEAGCSTPQKAIAQLRMLDEQEHREMLWFVNREEGRVGETECLHHWFERRAELNADSLAVTFEESTLSYGDLNRKANQLAHHLVGCGVRPGSLVGLCLDRSPDLVVAILAVLKAGGAYLPIDLSYPADRLRFMLEDAQAPVLLTEEKLLSSLPEHHCRTICLDDVDEILSQQPTENPHIDVATEDIAYVIYTSGSTGKPKGCMVTHANVSRLMRSTDHWYQFNEKDVWTLFHSSAFDFSVWEIWGALLYGGRLVVVPFMVSRSPEAFYELLARERVTVLNQTPSAFRQLIQAEEAVGQRELALRYVIFGGEALEMQSLRPWFNRHGDQTPQLVNMYGITETTVHVTYRPITKDDLKSGSVIGIPLPDLQVYILDQQKQPVPIGVPGEMYVGGAGLARGYLRRPELTAQRFIPDHLTGTPGARLYKTGDLARFLPGHDIEYLGRIDDQVKIRGFRIELGEIESVLCEHPSIREAAVIAREDVPGSKRLVAYTVNSGPAPDVANLRDHLKKKLPDYMLPTAFVFLERLPLTTNGKIDRKALPAPEQQRPELSRRYTPPQTPLEVKLCEIWSKVLRVEQIGIHDNFFELGGDSILSIQVISMARREGMKLTPKLLFANQTIAELAAAGDVAVVAQHPDEVLSGDLPLTPIQHWFFEQNLADPGHYNQAFLFELKERLDPSVLERAVLEVSKHHDGLRLRYRRNPDGWRQFYANSDSETLLTCNDLANLEEAEQRQHVEMAATAAQASLNLETGPIWRVICFNLGPRARGRLLIVIHHMAVDGVSWRPLLEDLETAYQQLKSAEPVKLPPKSTSYKSWAEKLSGFANHESLTSELAHWKEVVDTISKLPDQFSTGSPENTEGLSKTIKVSLTSEETQALLQRAPAAYNTQINDILLTALAQAWRKSTGNAVFVSSLEGHGREHLLDDVDLSRTMGWFTSIYPVRLELPPESDGPGAALKSIKEQLRRVPNRGIGYGILRYLSGTGCLPAHEDPPILFNYLGQFDRITAGSKLFDFANEDAGPWHSPSQRRRYGLEINSVVIGGRLEFSWTYGPHTNAESTVVQLADESITALRSLIAHCTSSEEGGRTPSDFPLAGLDQLALDNLLEGRKEIEDIYPLSPIQTLFYSASPGAIQKSFDQWYCTLDGKLDVLAFQNAWRETLQRHSILRTSIHANGLRQPLQLVHRDVELPWVVEDWRNSSQGNDSRWNDFLRADRNVPLNLTDAPVMRFALLRLSDETWKFLWSVPALLLDGWSWPVVFRDVSRLYESFSQKLSPRLEAVRPYRDYISWLSTRPSSDAKEFWRDALAGFQDPTPLPTETTDSNTKGGTYVEYELSMSPEASTSVQAAARRLQLTVSTIIQGAWGLLLSQQSGRDDVVFGAAFAGRPTDLAGVETIVGPFVNNLPVRVRIDKDQNAGDFLRGTHSRLLELSAFQFTPLIEIHACTDISWRRRLFDSLVVFQNYLVDDSARRLGTQIQIADFSGPIHTNYPLMLLAEPGEALKFKLIYDSRNIARTTIEQWGRDFLALMEALPLSLNEPVADLLLLLSAPTGSVRKVKRTLVTEAQNFVPPQTDLEREIAEVWQNLFEIERVSIEENFFDLGGHSLLLVQMHTRLREALKTELPIVTLLEHPTIRSLALHLATPSVSIDNNGKRLQDRAKRQRDAIAQLRLKLNK